MGDEERRVTLQTYSAKHVIHVVGPDCTKVANDSPTREDVLWIYAGIYHDILAKFAMSNLTRLRMQPLRDVGALDINIRLTLEALASAFAQLRGDLKKRICALTSVEICILEELEWRRFAPYADVLPRDVAGLTSNHRSVERFCHLFPPQDGRGPVSGRLQRQREHRENQLELPQPEQEPRTAIVAPQPHAVPFSPSWCPSGSGAAGVGQAVGSSQRCASPASSATDPSVDVHDVDSPPRPATPEEDWPLIPAPDIGGLYTSVADHFDATLGSDNANRWDHLGKAYADLEKLVPELELHRNKVCAHVGTQDKQLRGMESVIDSTIHRWTPVLNSAS